MQHIELMGIFGIAFFASLGHCVGMCGGIVLAYSSLHCPSHIHFLRKIFYHLTYNFGRISTYVLLGCIVGGLGKVVFFDVLPKHFALLGMGILIVICGLGILFFPRILRMVEVSFSPYSPFFTFFGKLFKKKNLSSLYVLGLCNGLIPCGIVYYFLLTASVAGNALNGAIVMLIFGIATLPSLLLLGLFTSSLQSKKTLFLTFSGVGMLLLGGYEIYKAIRMWHLS